MVVVLLFRLAFEPVVNGETAARALWLPARAIAATTSSFACASVPVAAQVNVVVPSVVLAGFASSGPTANGPSKTSAQAETSFVDAVVSNLTSVRVPAMVTRE